MWKGAVVRGSDRGARRRVELEFVAVLRDLMDARGSEWWELEGGGPGAAMM